MKRIANIIRSNKTLKFNIVNKINLQRVFKVIITYNYLKFKILQQEMYMVFQE